MEKQYHRPLVVFYMSYIPQKGNRGHDFRTLAGNYSKKEDALVDALIRDIQVRQSIIRSSLEDEEEELQTIPFVGAIHLTDDIRTTAEFIINSIHFDLKNFYAQTSANHAFSYLRNQVEASGIFVLLMSNLGSFHTEIDINGFRGFSLADEIAPFIVINEQDSKGALAFTLFHELTHICLGQTGISNNNPGQEIEHYCDQVASEALLPSAILDEFSSSNLDTFDDWKISISLFAEKHNISHSMVVYRLFQKGLIDDKFCTRLLKYYRDTWIEGKQAKHKSRKNSGGPNYYVVHRYQVGNGLINLVQRLISAGNLSTTKAGKVLGVKPTNVESLIFQSR